MSLSKDLLQKYNVAVPRYTSYPTVPFWKEGLYKENWLSVFQQQFALHNKKEGISIYIHLPFCERLCTYCGCNKKITTNHSVEDEYIQILLKEWNIYLSKMEETPVIRELHLGGGTPTFFSPDNLKYFLNKIFESAIIHPDHNFSFEGHPNNTTEEHLKTLYSCGFRRVSYGVQDHNIEVQRIINRIQPFENVKRATETAREIGYGSVNFDLIYGLPLQNLERIERTIEESITLLPDRIAFYSYAHVPWTSKGQRLYSEADLPSTETKMELYRTGKLLFTSNGYHDIGMDHFALENDELFIAQRNGELHRNFMGYTTQQTSILLGLGVSSISDAGVAYAQNHKTLHEYYQSVAKGELPVTKGYFLSDEDSAFKRYILNVSCNGKTTFKPEHLDLLRKYSFPELSLLEKDELIEWNEKGLEVTELGKNFIRNICRAFDLYIMRNQNSTPEKPLFSKAI